MALATRLTLFRLAVAPVFLVVFFSGLPGRTIWAAMVFALAMATDALDGYVARRRQEVTALGRFLDPLADKVILSLAVVSLALAGFLPAWISACLVGREVVVAATAATAHRRRVL